MRYRKRQSRPSRGWRERVGGEDTLGRPDDSGTSRRAAALTDEFVELAGPQQIAGRYLFTCEHASSATPGLQPDSGDRVWLRSHWGVDLGAGELTRDLVQLLDCPAVLAGFSRLVCDVNRSEESPTFILRCVEGHKLSFKRALHEGERLRRVDEFSVPYHQAIDQLLTRRVCGPLTLISIHSFTPVFRGSQRDTEVGVLHTTNDGEALRLANALREDGFRSVLNQPYTGWSGQLSAALRHGWAHGVPYLELEVRQDLLEDRARARHFAVRLAHCMNAALGT